MFFMSGILTGKRRTAPNRWPPSRRPSINGCRPLNEQMTGVIALVAVGLIEFVPDGLRVEQENEIEGLDSAVHGERAFELQ